jgi:hypothetical protein
LVESQFGNCTGHTQIGDPCICLSGSCAVEEHICRLEVLMKEASGMHMGQRIEYLVDHAECFCHRWAPLEQVGEAALVCVSQGHKGPATLEHTGVQDGDDSGVDDLCGEGHFASKSGAKAGVNRQISSGHLDRHFAAEKRVLCSIYRTRRALTDLIDQGVAVRSLGQINHSASEREVDVHFQLVRE